MKDGWKAFAFCPFFMRRPAYGNLLLTQHAGRAASREKIFPTRLYTPMQMKYATGVAHWWRSSRGKDFPLLDYMLDITVVSMV